MTVLQLFQLGVKNAQRRVSRTLLTMGMVAVSTALLVLTLGWLNGVMDQLIDDSVAISGHVTVADAVYNKKKILQPLYANCLLYTSPSPRDGLLSRLPSSA